MTQPKPQQQASIPATSDLLVKVSWARAADGAPDPDVDLQAVLFDEAGVATEAVYWNSPRSADGSVAHHGDTAGRCQSEEMSVALPQLGVPTACVAFTVSSFDTRVPLGAVLGLVVCVEERPRGPGPHPGRLLWTMTPTVAAGAMVHLAASLRRDPMADAWAVVCDTADLHRGATFAACIPELRGHLGLPTPPHDAGGLSVPVQLEKGHVVSLAQQRTESAGPLPASGQHVVSADAASALGAPGSCIVAGAGWDIVNGEECDVDLSCVLLDGHGEALERVYWGNLTVLGGAVQHTGDNLTGEGEGDDEQILLQLRRLPPATAAVAFVVNNYDAGNLSQLRNIAFRLAVRTAAGRETELLRADAIGAGGNYSGFVPCLLQRDHDGWKAVCVAATCPGKTLFDQGVAARLKQLAHDDGRRCVKPVNLRRALGPGALPRTKPPQAAKAAPLGRTTAPHAVAAGSGLDSLAPWQRVLVFLAVAVLLKMLLFSR